MGLGLNRNTCLVLCFITTTIGIVAGWLVGEQRGIAALPPNAWAGDGIGILIKSMEGSCWGALGGLGFGIICCLAWHFHTRRRQAQGVVPQASVPDDQVWPPAPTDGL